MTYGFNGHMWEVTYGFNDHRVHLGCYDDHTEAAEAHSSRHLLAIANGQHTSIDYMQYTIGNMQYAIGNRQQTTANIQ